MLLCEKLLSEHSERLNGSAKPLHRAVLVCLITSAASTRQKCMSSAKRLVSGLGGALLSRSLLRELVVFLETVKIWVSFSEALHLLYYNPIFLEKD